MSELTDEELKAIHVRMQDFRKRLTNLIGKSPLLDDAMVLDQVKKHMAFKFEQFVEDTGYLKMTFTVLVEGVKPRREVFSNCQGWIDFCDWFDSVSKQIRKEDCALTQIYLKSRLSECVQESIDKLCNSWDHNLIKLSRPDHNSISIFIVL
jgi:hypothetical protein